MRLRPPHPLASSVAVHLGALAIVLVMSRFRRPTAVESPPPLPAVTVDFDTPETPAPQPVEPTPQPAPEPRAAPSSLRATAPERRAAQPAGEPASGPVGEPAPAQPEPPSQPAQTAPPAPRIDAMELLRSARHDAEALVASGAMALDVSSAQRPSRDLVHLPTGTPLERARAASAGYVRDRLAEAPARPEAPGVRTYFWHLRRRMTETWRPGVAREPSLGQTLLSTLGMPFEAQQRAAELAMGAAAHPGRMGSANDALDAAGGHSNSDAMHSDPMQGNGPRPMFSIVDLAQLNSYITRAEIEVDQREDGSVVDIRVVRSSRIQSYDEAAMAAVREALPLQTPARMPGGRRSRWSFQTVASRAPFVPAVGMAFDESSGWFEVVYPGRVTMRSRVWLESARPLGT